MIWTEEEASHKWCPETLASGAPASCAGSGCMAWREVKEEVEFGETLPERSLSANDGWEEIDNHGRPGRRWVRIKQKAGGYCGKMGKPE